MNSPKWTPFPGQPCSGPLSMSSTSTTSAAVTQGSPSENHQESVGIPQNMARERPVKGSTKRGRRKNSQPVTRTSLRALRQKPPPSEPGSSSSLAAENVSHPIAAPTIADRPLLRPCRPERGKPGDGYRVEKRGKDKDKGHSRTVQNLQKSPGILAFDNSIPSHQRSSSNINERGHRQFKESETTSDEDSCPISFLSLSSGLMPLQALVNRQCSTTIVHRQGLDRLGLGSKPLPGWENMLPVVHPWGVFQPKSYARLVCLLPGTGAPVEFQDVFVDERPYRGVDVFLGTDFMSMIGGCLPRDLPRGEDAAAQHVTVTANPPVLSANLAYTFTGQGVDQVHPPSVGDGLLGGGSSTLIGSGANNIGYASPPSVAQSVVTDLNPNAWSIPASLPLDNNVAMLGNEQMSTMWPTAPTETDFTYFQPASTISPDDVTHTGFMSDEPVLTGDWGTGESTGEFTLTDEEISTIFAELQNNNSNSDEEISNILAELHNNDSNFGEDRGTDFYRE